MAASTMRVRGSEEQKGQGRKGSAEWERGTVDYLQLDGSSTGLLLKPLASSLCSLPEAHPKRLSSTGRPSSLPASAREARLLFPRPARESRGVRFPVQSLRKRQGLAAFIFFHRSCGARHLPSLSPADGGTFLPLGGHLLCQNKDMVPSLVSDLFSSEERGRSKGWALSSPKADILGSLRCSEKRRLCTRPTPLWGFGAQVGLPRRRDHSRPAHLVTDGAMSSA